MKIALLSTGTIRNFTLKVSKYNLYFAFAGKCELTSMLAVWFILSVLSIYIITVCNLAWSSLLFHCTQISLRRCLRPAHLKM